VFHPQFLVDAEEVLLGWREEKNRIKENLSLRTLNIHFYSKSNHFHAIAPTQNQGFASHGAVNLKNKQ